MNAFVLLIFYAVKFSPVQLVEMFRIHRLRKKKKVTLSPPLSNRVCVIRLFLWDRTSWRPTGGRRHRAVSSRAEDWRGASRQQLPAETRCDERVEAAWLQPSLWVCPPYATRPAVLTMLRFVIAFPSSVHVAQMSIALGTMLYLISRKICLTERKKCGLASLLFWFTESEKDNYNACNVSYTCTT